MSRKRKKKRIPKKVIFIIIVAILLIIGLALIKYRLEPNQIIEIPNTVDYYEDPSLDYIDVTRFCIVTKPPETELELKNLIIDYYKSNKSKIESLENHKTKRKYAIYTIYFYKETWNFTRYWRPDLRWIKYDEEDVWNQLRDHYDENIGFITFKPENEGDSFIHINLNEEIEIYDIPNSVLE